MGGMRVRQLSRYDHSGIEVLGDADGVGSSIISWYTMIS